MDMHITSTYKTTPVDATAAILKAMKSLSDEEDEESMDSEDSTDTKVVVLIIRKLNFSTHLIYRTRYTSN